MTAGCHCQLQSRCLLYHAVPQTLKPSEAFLSAAPPPPPPLLFYSWGSGFICRVLCCRFKETNCCKSTRTVFRLNDISLRRLANRKENIGRSALKPRVFRQISCSVSQRDPLKCYLSSRGPPEEILSSRARARTHPAIHMRACFLRATWELMDRKIMLDYARLWH